MHAKSIAAILLTIAGTACAAEHSQRISLLVIDPGHASHSATGTTWTGGIGGQYSFGLTSRLSLDSRFALERHIDYFTSLFRPNNPPGPDRPVDWERRATTHSWTEALTFRGERIGRWTPHLGAGVRSVHAPIAWYDARRAVVPLRADTLQGTYYSDRASAELSAGADLALAPRLAVQVEVQRLLRRSIVYDQRVTGIFGVTWQMR